MKLCSLYIENFGGLSRYELQFEPGLTTVREPNGFGKTTLAEFIRAMLYGFPRKVKTLEKSRRQKYAPWNGGQYGGNLVFEHEGRRYRLERTFGTTPKGDTFNLIDLATNRKSNRFSEEIGIQLFGLDSDSFERSTYLPQSREDGPLATAAIQAKLSDLVEDSSDVRSFDKAIAALKAKRSALIPYRGSSGTVAEASARISQLQLELEQAEMQQEMLQAERNQAAQAEGDIEHTKAALAQLRKDLTEASAHAAMQARRRQYSALQTRLAQTEEVAAFYRKKYPQGLPEEDAIRQAEAAADSRAILAAQHTTDPAEQQAMQFLREHAALEKRLPAASELENCRRKCEAYEAAQTKIRDLQMSTAQLVQLERQQLHTGQQSAAGGLLTAAIAALIIGAAGVVAGAVLMVLREYLYGAIGLTAGIGAMAAGVIILCIRHRKNLQWRQNVLAQRRKTDEQIAAAQQEIAALQQTATRQRQEISRFLSSWFDGAEPARFSAYLSRLEQDTQRYAQAQQQVQQWQQRKRQHDRESEACRAALEAFFAQLGIAMEQDVRAQLRQLRADIRDVQAAQSMLRELAQQMAALHSEAGDSLSDEVPDTAEPETLLQEEQRLSRYLTERTEQLLHCRQRIQQLRGRVSEMPTIREELERLQRKKTEEQENARILDDTVEFLQQAREQLSAGYLGTVQSRFGLYLAQLEGVSDERFFVDTDLQVQLERLGQARELAYFSAGQTDLVMLCMRFALVDALFGEQETFVILDDPFVNLDDAHTAQAMALLQTLSRHRQILYLTCHSSRTI